MGVVPDVLTMGKPMANGHPVGGVVARPEIMAAFREGFRYFNTFAGNPVSCAAAMAVLDEIEEKDLIAHASRVGDHARARLEHLATRHEAIGDVRGRGMVFGAEFVLDRDSKAPATAFADRVVNALRHRGFLLSKLGRHRNTLKIRPPMPFGIDHADLLIDTLDAVLSETPLAP
jgi:4-aminobutyrate aminotransferase-like enzyme